MKFGMLIASFFLFAGNLSLAQSLTFQEVTSKICDGVTQSAAAGERITIIEQQALLGLGHTASDTCRIVDFHSFVVTSNGQMNGQKMMTMEVLQKTALRKSSCSNNVSEVPTQFKVAQYTGKKLTLLGGANCRKLELILK